MERFCCPSLDIGISDLHYPLLPILYAANIAKAPLHITLDIVNHFDCI